MSVPGAQCPVCSAWAIREIKVPPARYRVCSNCGTMFQDPMPSTAEMIAYANREYASGVYRDYLAAADLKRATFRRRMALVESRAPGRRLLDVGASCGYLLDVALERRFDAFGLEFSSVAVAAASPQSRPRITVGDANQLDQLSTDPFDVVTAFDTIEHVLDPIAFLRQVRGALRRPGLLVLSTPDTGHLLRYLMRARWPMLQPFQHTVLFSRRSMRAALTSSGYRDIHVTTATKTLTPQYLASQVRDHNPLIARMYGALSILLPRALREAPMSVNIGEMLVFAWAAEV